MAVRAVTGVPAYPVLVAEVLLVVVEEPMSSR
jgi:hypothetical protein